MITSQMDDELFSSRHSDIDGIRRRFALALLHLEPRRNARRFPHCGDARRRVAAFRCFSAFLPQIKVAARGR